MKTKVFVILLGLLPVLIVSPVLLITVVTAKDASCDVSGAASPVDAGSVPQGPIAGFGQEQLVNAAQIMSAAAALGLTVRDQQIGVMTAMGESGLRVLDYGDSAGPDSRGLFQQRDNGAWGSLADRMDPFTSSISFFRVLAALENRDSMEPTLVANAVQRNADPYHYAKFWDGAGEIVQALRGVIDSRPAVSHGQTTYSLDGVQPRTAAIANTIGPMFGIHMIGGYRVASSVYDDLRYGHPAGLALDFMINDLDDGTATGDRLAAHLIEQADTLGIAYIIWKQAIWSPDRASEGWRAMEDRGSPTQNHYDHVHLSLTGEGSGVIDPCASGDGGRAVAASGWAAPADGAISSRFAENRTTYGMHYGLDIAAPCEAPIVAAGAGTVDNAGPASGYGNWIVIDHGGGVRTIYGHMYSAGVLTSVGSSVSAGQLIGRVGSAGQSSGCHLHFQVELNGTPVDPVQFLADRGVRLTSGAN